MDLQRTYDRWYRVIQSNTRDLRDILDSFDIERLEDHRDIQTEMIAIDDPDRADESVLITLPVGSFNAGQSMIACTAATITCIIAGYFPRICAMHNWQQCRGRVNCDDYAEWADDDEIFLNWARDKVAGLPACPSITIRPTP